MKHQSIRFAVLSATLAIAPAALFAQGPPDTTADAVYGQGSFTGNTGNRGQANPSDNTLSRPQGIVADSAGGLYVTDGNNNRVLYYPSGSQIPIRVYGQTDSFNTGTANKGGVSANSLNNPAGLAVDSTGLYVADFGNHRVLHFPVGGTTADRVYGQGGSFTTNASNQGAAAPTRTSLALPVSIAVDSAGGIYVADFTNNRVLHYSAGSTIADRVYGQGGDFTTATANKGGLSATSLRTPEGVDTDANDGLYVVDRDNNRVLHFPSGSTVADRVYGQGNLFTSATANLGGISNESLSAPIQMVADNTDGLYITDFSNNRVLHYTAGSVIADRVYGQSNAFNTNTANKGGNPASADSLLTPFGVAFDPGGNLFIADLGNNRVLKFDAPPPTAPTILSITTNPSPAVAGQQFSFTVSGSNFNPASVQVEITGPTCNPCVVINSLLTTKTASSVSGVTTLATAGSYIVVVRNGAGTAQSAGVALTVSAAGGGGGTTCGCDFNGDSRVDISDVISMVRLVQNGTTLACHANTPFTIADVIHVVTVVLGTASCRL